MLDGVFALFIELVDVLGHLAVTFVLRGVWLLFNIVPHLGRSGFKHNLVVVLFYEVFILATFQLGDLICLGHSILGSTVL